MVNNFEEKIDKYIAEFYEDFEKSDYTIISIENQLDTKIEYIDGIPVLDLDDFLN